MIACMCKIKKDSLCRLKINHKSGLKHAFILGTPVLMVANNRILQKEPLRRESEKILLMTRIKEVITAVQPEYHNYCTHF